MTSQDKINLGHAAATLLDDPAYKAAVERYEADLFRRWKDATELSIREALWAECQALTGVTARLSTFRTDGAVARNRT